MKVSRRFPRESVLVSANMSKDAAAGLNSVLSSCDFYTVANTDDQVRFPCVRLCPSCHTMIRVKHTSSDPKVVDRCKHMTCGSCGKAFCGYCLQMMDPAKGWPCGSAFALCPVAPAGRQKVVPKE